MRVDKKLLMAVYHGKNYIKDDKYVVNRIGYTTYISFDDLEPSEIIAIGKFKKIITKETKSY